MEQILFVLHDGKISQWNLSRGKLKAATINGLRQVPYSAATAKKYWDGWKEDNQVLDEDIYDSIFLSDGPNDFGKLPVWICANAEDKSAWTFEQLSLIAQEEDFKQTGLCLVQGKAKCLVGTGKADTAVSLCLKSSLAFALPKEAPMPKPAPTPKKEPVVEKPTFVADSYNDAKALALKVGEKVVGTVTTVSTLRNCCYMKSDSADDLIKIKLTPTGKTEPAKDFKVGMKLTAEVVSVKDKRVEYRIVM